MGWLVADGRWPELGHGAPGGASDQDGGRGLGERSPLAGAHEEHGRGGLFGDEALACCHRDLLPRLVVMSGLPGAAPAPSSDFPSRVAEPLRLDGDQVPRHVLRWRW